MPFVTGSDALVPSSFMLLVVTPGATGFRRKYLDLDSSKYATIFGGRT